MQCVKSEVDYRFTYPLRAMAEALEKYAVYNTQEYKDFHAMLDERAAELNCHVDKIAVVVPFWPLLGTASATQWYHKKATYMVPVP
jgi:hypothetical protein